MGVRTFIGGFFLFLWRFLDGLRKVLHLVLLLILFGVVFGALGGSLAKVPASAALVIAPQGTLVEQLSGNPLERAVDEAQGQGRAETLLWDLIDCIRQAADDKRIKVLVLDLERFEGAGQPTLEELATAIQDFKKSGKKVIAYGTYFLQGQYYLAAQADEIYLDPMAGFVLIDGYGRYGMYFKQALDKLGVDMNVFRVGQYKSAVEPFTRSDMSAQDREESLAYLSSLWSTYQQAATKARKLKPDALVHYVDTLSSAATAAHGNLAKVALDAKLVTGLKSRQDVEKHLIALVGENKDTGSFQGVSNDQYINAVRAEQALTDGGKDRVGVVVASGEILDGDQPAGRIGGASTARLIREARVDDKVKALVLRVDSPGGSVTASEEIYREILAFKQTGRPVVVSMSSLAASGGYYISAPANEIWASPATLTGSIGIFAVIPTIDRTLAKAGVTVDGVGTTPLSGQLRLDRPMNEQSKLLMQSMIEYGYEEFLKRVATGRSKTRDEIDRIAQGRVWSGVAAKEAGLVDRLGSFDDAVESAAKLAKLKDYDIDFVEPELSWMQEIALQVKAWGVKTMLSGDRNTRALAQVARQFDPILQEADRLARFSVPNRLYAYCFCSAR